MNGEHEPVPIEPLEEFIFLGYSTAPDLHCDGNTERWAGTTLSTPLPHISSPNAVP